MEAQQKAMNVVHNAAEHSFEVELNGEVALLRYELLGKQLALVHTEVPKALGGGGIAGKLAKAALEYARANHLTVLPICSFVKSYLERHPEYQNLVASQ
jgi:predicted GNAT family acetyltransferase